MQRRPDKCKKRFVVFGAALALCLTVPFAALADKENLNPYLAIVMKGHEPTVNIDMTEDKSGEGWSFVASTHTLILDGLDAQNIQLFNAEYPVAVEIAGDSSLDMGIFFKTKGGVTVFGDGTLTIGGTPAAYAELTASDDTTEPIIILDPSAEEQEKPEQPGTEPEKPPVTDPDEEEPPVASDSDAEEPPVASDSDADEPTASDSNASPSGSSGGGASGSSLSAQMRADSANAVYSAALVLGGEWRLDENGWWFVGNDGSYPKNVWAELTWNGQTGWYYFNEIPSGPIPLGTMFVSTMTPDGYRVDRNGVWIP